MFNLNGKQNQSSTILTVQLKLFEPYQRLSCKKLPLAYEGSKDAYQLPHLCSLISCSSFVGCIDITYKPRCEKTGLRGFRPGPTKTGLYSHRRWLEASRVEKLYYLCSENKGADQLCGYRTTDLHLCFRICKNPVFS